MGIREMKEKLVGVARKKAGRGRMGRPSTDVGGHQNEGQEGEVCSVRRGGG